MDAEILHLRMCIQKQATHPLWQTLNNYKITGQGFTHQYLWNCATTRFTRPETKVAKDMYYAMAGMVMAYFTFEAYMNFVGKAAFEPSRLEG